MELSPSTSRAHRRANPNAQNAHIPPVNTLMTRAAISTKMPRAHQPMPRARLQATSHPDTTAIQEAVEELRLFLPGVNPDRMFYHRGLVPMRLNEEAGKGQPPVLVMNDPVTYFGYELLPLESAKFGSTLHASRMVEPEYLGALLERPKSPVPPHPKVESCDDGSFEHMMQFLDLSACKETPVAGPVIEEEQGGVSTASMK